MRIAMMMIGLAAGAALLAVQPVAAAKTKMGCEIGKEVWNAVNGKCEPGTSKYAGKIASKSVKKAPAKK